MRTRYVIDDFQQIYFVISSFENMLEERYQDFGTLYDRLETLSDIEPPELATRDEVITRGTLEYFKQTNTGLAGARRIRSAVESRTCRAS